MSDEEFEVFDLDDNKLIQKLLLKQYYQTRKQEQNFMHEKRSYMKNWRKANKLRKVEEAGITEEEFVRRKIDRSPDTAIPNMTNDVLRFLKHFDLIDAASFDFYSTELFKKRTEHLLEEVNELNDATSEVEVIDALLDTVYIALGTLHLMKVDVAKHWREIQRANMDKERGPSKRGHDFDVFKPEGWVEPQHAYIREKATK